MARRLNGQALPLVVVGTLEVYHVSTPGNAYHDTLHHVSLERGRSLRTLCLYSGTHRHELTQLHGVSVAHEVGNAVNYSGNSSTNNARRNSSILYNTATKYRRWDVGVRTFLSIVGHTHVTGIFPRQRIKLKLSHNQFYFKLYDIVLILGHGIYYDVGGIHQATQGACSAETEFHTANRVSLEEFSSCTANGVELARYRPKAVKRDAVAIHDEVTNLHFQRVKALLKIALRDLAISLCRLQDLGSPNPGVQIHGAVILHALILRGFPRDDIQANCTITSCHNFTF